MLERCVVEEHHKDGILGFVHPFDVSRSTFVDEIFKEDELTRIEECHR